MSVAFWSIKLTSGQSKVVQPPDGYVLNLQQVALEVAADTKPGTFASVKASTISIESEPLEAVLATLRPQTTEQINLGLVFGYDVPVTFLVAGTFKGAVHLSGYYQPGPDDDEDGDDDDEDDDEDDDDEEDPALGAEDDDEEDDDEDGGVDEAFIKKMIAQSKAKPNPVVSKPAAASGKLQVQELDEEDDEDDEDEDDEDEDDEDEDDEDEDDEDEDDEPPAKAIKTSAAAPIKSGGTPGGMQNKNQQQQHSGNKVHQSGGKPQQQQKPNTPKPTPGQQGKTPVSQGKPGQQQHQQKSGQKNIPHSGDKRKN